MTEPAVSRKKLQLALAAYAALALAAGLLLKGDLRLVIWILFGGLAIKTLAAYRLHQDRPGPPEPKPSADSDSSDDSEEREA